MDEKIIDGKKIALKRQEELVTKVKQLGKTPTVVSIIVGDDPPSLLYTKMKQKKAQEVGINFQYMHFPSTEDFSQVGMTIIKLNQDITVDGVMVQLPLPKEFLGERSSDQLLQMINPVKDVDGLTGQGKFLPAAVKAVMTIINEEQIPVNNRFVAVLGSSKLVGLPITEELKRRGARVMNTNSQTPHIASITKQADLIVSATGVENLLTGNMVKQGVVVIDVGTLVIEDQLSEDGEKKVVGDVDFESVYPKATKITPVPGGVGPLTVISLMENVVQATDSNVQ